MEDKHPIDKLFREGLREPEIPFDAGDWELMTKKMQPHRKRIVPLFAWLASGAAAAMVLAAILWLGDRQHPTTGNMPAQTTRTDKSDRSVAGPAGKPADSSAQPKTTVVPPALITHHSESQHNGSPDYRNPHAVPTTVADAPLLAPVPFLKPAATSSLANSTTKALRITPLAQTIPPTSPSSQEANSIASTPSHANIGQPRWTLSVVAAPDLSGIRPGSGGFSGNAGLMATYRLKNWLSVSAGALYAKKIYEANFDNYRPDGWRGNNTTNPGLVNADCAVLDIPILANLTLKRLDRSEFFISTGISSYFMLRETYDYTYPPETGKRPWELTLRNQNRHLLGVGNLSIGYRRRLSPVVSLTAQPFLKVPLTGIGNGNIKLYSTGLSISADIDLR